MAPPPRKDGTPKDGLQSGREHPTGILSYQMCYPYDTIVFTHGRTSYHAVGLSLIAKTKKNKITILYHINKIISNAFT